MAELSPARLFLAVIHHDLTVLQDHPRSSQDGNTFQWVTLDDNQVRQFPGFHCPQVIASS